MEITCNISAQYYENYGSEEAPYWKPKGGQMFTVKVDSDDMFYMESDRLHEALTKMIAAQSDSYTKYEYLSHELEWVEPIKLDSGIFEHFAGFEKS